jgi:predicted TIM-barrel fold metal-dependent hydrolase
MPRYDGPVVDAHHHFWKPAEHHHPWLEPGADVGHRYGDYNAIKRPYLPADLRADAMPYRLAGSVYIEAEWTPGDALSEIRHTAAIAAAEGLPSAIVAQAWLEQPDAYGQLAAVARNPMVRGVRQKPERRLDGATAAAGSLLEDPAWRDGFALLADLGLRFDLQAGWPHTSAVARLLRDFPGTQVVLDHAGLPPGPDADMTGWQEAISLLARHDTIFVKLSGIGARAPDGTRTWPVSHNAIVTRTLLDLFGTERVMFGSNFPVDSLCASYDRILSALIDAVHEISPAAVPKVFHDNAIEFYGLGHVG